MDAGPVARYFQNLCAIKTHDDETALCGVWSLETYLAWQREQEERDEAAREMANIQTIEHDDPECEAAVRALEEGWRGVRNAGGSLDK